MRCLIENVGIARPRAPLAFADSGIAFEHKTQTGTDTDAVSGETTQTTLGLGPFVYPGGCGAVMGSSNRYVTLPGLISASGFQADKGGNIAISAKGAEEAGFAPIFKTRTPAFIVTSNGKKKSGAGLVMNPEISFASASSASYAVGESGSVALTANWTVFPALCDGDAVRFFIPMLCTRKRVLSLTHKKIASTYLQFFYNEYGSTTKKATINLNDASAFDLVPCDFGVEVVYHLSASASFTAGIVEPNNLSNAITLAWTGGAA